MSGLVRRRTCWRTSGAGRVWVLLGRRKRRTPSQRRIVRLTAWPATLVAVLVRWRVVAPGLRRLRLKMSSPRPSPVVATVDPHLLWPLVLAVVVPHQSKKFGLVPVVPPLRLVHVRPTVMTVWVASSTFLHVSRRRRESLGPVRMVRGRFGTT